MIVLGHVKTIMLVEIFKTLRFAMVLVQNCVEEYFEYNTSVFSSQEQELIEFKRVQKLLYYNSLYQS